MKNSVFPFYVRALLGHPLHEIQERAMKSLALKLQGRLISRSEITSKYPRSIGTILVWLNEKQKTAKPECLADALQILVTLSEVNI